MKLTSPDKNHFLGGTQAKAVTPENMSINQNYEHSWCCIVIENLAIDNLKAPIDPAPNFTFPPTPSIPSPQPSPQHPPQHHSTPPYSTPVFCQSLASLWEISSSLVLRVFHFCSAVVRKAHCLCHWLLFS